MNPSEELSKFVTVELNAETTEEQLVKKLVEVSKIMDDLYFEQVYSKNKEAKEQAQKIGGDTLKLFELYKCPFNRIDHGKPFIEGHDKPKGANFYPEDMDEDDFEKESEKNPEFKSHLTVIKTENEKLVCIPYSVEYKQKLEEAAKLLQDAANISKNISLKNYLEKLSEAFLKNNYFESDVAWMDLDSDIEPTIGPYEVYEDELFGLKATFEAVIGIKDKEATEKVKLLETKTEMLEKNLPIHDEFKNLDKGKHSPIAVINEVYSAGDCRAGIHFTAFNLPNDEKVKKIKGSKKVMIKNVAEAKFKHCMTPILKEIFPEEELKNTNFESYFMFILLHEISHGLGPGYLNKNGKEITVNQALKETYPAIEEAKADILGVYNSFVLADEGFFTKEQEKQIVSSYIGSIFRSIRFGVQEAHAAANIISLNFLKEKGLVKYENGKYKINHEMARESFTELSNKLLMIEALGDYEESKRFIQKYKVVTEDVKDTIKKLENISVDIYPVYKY